MKEKDDIDHKRKNASSLGGAISENIIEAFALENALEHGGNANIGSVMGKVMRFSKEDGININPRDTTSIVTQVVHDVNTMTTSEQKERSQHIGGPIELNKRERREGLPELENAEMEKVVMRFAPGPSGPLHIGHTRAAVLNDIYCKRYHGKFILRIEDTNPEKIDPEAYDMIPEDLDWLRVAVSNTYIQSDRFEVYYDIARQLIEKDQAYICTMNSEKWRQLKSESRPCPERDLPRNYHLEGWEKMLDGTFAPEEASLVIKTDLGHKNPAVRDFVGMRINETLHPRTGDRYRVYPLYNLSVAIDDHLMGCTHILRGKDHLNNTFRQKYVYKHLDWELPKFIHYGLVSIRDTFLKTSLIREEIGKGTYSGWNDIRIGTLRALSTRGIQAEALRNYWNEVGMKSVDITFSWDNLYAMNKEIIEKDARRYFFVPGPKRITLEGVDRLEAEIPLYPDEPDRGTRKFEIEAHNGAIELIVPEEELIDLDPGETIRLKGLCNIKVTDPVNGKCKFIGQDISNIRRGKNRIIQWLPVDAEPCRILLPDGTVVNGMAEKDVLKEAEKGSIIQFERVGFFKLYLMDVVVGRFTHK
ncbi:MAG: glutamate--tRNA ligase [Candidatus Thermoplasmatota archaeon]|nr:glutamate--tRNA ligase [Candidatus Thermoplasmatota archaeon]